MESRQKWNEQETGWNSSRGALRQDLHPLYISVAAAASLLKQSMSARTRNHLPVCPHLHPQEKMWRRTRTHSRLNEWFVNYADNDIDIISGWTTPVVIVIPPPV